MAKVKRQGHLDDVEQLTMRAARRIHKRLRKSGKVRRSFRRWFRVEGKGFDMESLPPKPASLLKAA